MNEEVKCQYAGSRKETSFLLFFFLMYVEEMIFLILQFSNIKTSGKAHFDQLVMARFNNEEILNSVGLPSQLLQQIKIKKTRVIMTMMKVKIDLPNLKISEERNGNQNL